MLTCNPVRAGDALLLWSAFLSPAELDKIDEERQNALQAHAMHKFPSKPSYDPGRSHNCQADRDIVNARGGLKIDSDAVMVRLTMGFSVVDGSSEVWIHIERIPRIGAT